MRLEVQSLCSLNLGERCRVSMMDTKHFTPCNHTAFAEPEKHNLQMLQVLDCHPDYKDD
jgi:hypothetical protein